MARLKKIKKGDGKTKFGAFEDVVFKDVLCSKCDREYVKIDGNALSGVCWKCVQGLVGNPPEPNQNMNAKRRVTGWQLYSVWVDYDGMVWHKGVEQPELKGTLEPMDVAKINDEKKAAREKRKVEREAKLLERAAGQKAARKARAEKKAARLAKIAEREQKKKERLINKEAREKAKLEKLKVKGK